MIQLQNYIKGGADMFNEARMMGVIAGIAVGLLFTFVIFRFVNRNKKMTTEYDEMQQQIRGVGYKYAFYTVILYEALMGVLMMGTEVPAEPYVIHFAAIFLGVTVQASYCIWNDAYVGLNTNLKRFIAVTAIVSVINLAVAFIAWRTGSLFADGRLQAQTTNLLCGLMFAVLGITGLARKLSAGREDE